MHHEYYCKHCENNIMIFDSTEESYILNFCLYTQSKNFNSIFFLDCMICKKFIGIKCNNVCTKCFNKNPISAREEKLLEWFLKYKKIINAYENELFIFKKPCKICNTNNFRSQFWFFKELTFYK